MSWLYHSTKSWFGCHWRGLIVGVLATVFFLATAAFNYLTQTPDFVKWSSPDETANYVMARQLAITGQPMIFSKYNLVAQGIIAPRSLRADGAWLKPVSFLGIIVYYGLAAKLFGLGILPYLTPLLGALGVIFFYLLIKKLFGRDQAVIAAGLLAAFPVYVYYSARSMFHNVPFAALLIIGVYLAVLSVNSLARSPYRQWLYALLGGLFCGLAATFRTSELIWLSPVLVVLWLFNLKQLKLLRPLLFVYGFVMAFAPVFYYNYILYGSALASGYPNLDSSVTAIVSGSGQFVKNAVLTKFDLAEKFLKQVYHSFFYFGFNPTQSWTMFNRYLLKMFPWLAFLGGAGLVIFCVQFWRRKKGDLVYLLSLILTGGLLVLYYGSWKFFDNPDPASFTIGNSYTRYWLPLYLLLLPLAGLAILKVSRILVLKKAIVAGRVGAVLLIAGLSITFVLVGSEEGLLATAYRQRLAKQEFKLVLAATEPHSIIVTRYGDKLFFPERQVIVGLLTDDNMNAIYARLAKRVPVYYYNFSLSDADLLYLNDRKLKPLGVALKLKQVVTKDFSLYDLKTIK